MRVQWYIRDIRWYIAMVYPPVSAHDEETPEHFDLLRAVLDHVELEECKIAAYSIERVLARAEVIRDHVPQSLRGMLCSITRI